jgi:hypothetical protein
MKSAKTRATPIVKPSHAPREIDADAQLGRKCIRRDGILRSGIVSSFV